MQSVVIAMLMPEDSPGATLLVRRADGQFAFERVDSRVACAARVAARLAGRVSADADQGATALLGLEMV
jgi:hypothetical protein